MAAATTTALDWLDLAFVSWLRVTLQMSLVVLLILAARAAFRGRLAPGARYGLWLLLALPLIAPLLPAPTIPLPQAFRRASSTTAASPRSSSNLPASDSAGWRVEYGPLSTSAPAAPKPATAAATMPVNWLRLGAITWAAGVALLVLRVVVMHVRAVRLALWSPAVDDGRSLSLLNECSGILGIRRPPHLVTSAAGAGPALLGVFRPRLLLPEGSDASLSGDELRFVFLHELVHLKRHDVLAEWLLAMLQIGHWFNPLIWLAASLCRADREIACDAAVIALTGEGGRCDYGRTILRLATEILPARRPRLAGMAAAVGILENRTPLERRLRMIASIPSRKPARWPAAAVAVVTLAVVACGNAQTPKPAPPVNVTAAADSTPTAIAADPKAGSIGDAPQGDSHPKTRELTSESKPVSNDVLEKLAALKTALTQAEKALLDKRIEYATRNDKARAYREMLDAEAQVNELRVKYEAQTVAAEKLNNAALQAQLDRRLPEITFTALGLSDVIEFIRDVSNANVFVNWKALEAAGIDRNTPVTARLHEVQLSKALQILLDSAAGDSKRLAFTADRGVITISTADDLERSGTITRVYDVRDLLVNIPNYAPDLPRDIDVESDAHRAAVAAATAAPRAEKVEAEAQAGRQRIIDDVIKLIRETIEPQGWGKTDHIRELSGQLIVTAPARVHEPLVQLLEQLRENRAIQVRLETKFLSVDDGILDALPPGLRELVAGELRAAKDPVAVPTDKPQAATAPAAAADRWKFAFLDEKQVEQLMQAVQADKKSAVVSAPRVMLFNGQSAYVLTQRQRAYVADYTTVKDATGGVKYEPLHGVVSAGVSLWAQATASADRKFATLSLRPRLTHVEGMEEVPWDRNPTGEKLTVSRPKLLASELSTTVSIPDGGTVLLGGLKAYMGEDADQPGAKATPVLMLVKPKLIIQREVQQKQFPLLEKK